MKFLINFANNIQKMSKKDFEKYLQIFLLAAFIFFGLLTYFIYSTSSSLVLQIKGIEKSLVKISQIIEDNKKIEAQEDKLKKLMEDNKEFNLRSVFEKFCVEQGLKPESDWFNTYSINSIEGNDRFEEVFLTANFKNLNMQNLINVLDTLSRNDMIFVKELEVKSEENKKLSFTITIGSVKEKGV